MGEACSYGRGAEASAIVFWKKLAPSKLWEGIRSIAVEAIAYRPPLPSIRDRAFNNLLSGKVGRRSNRDSLSYLPAAKAEPERIS